MWSENGSDPLGHGTVKSAVSRMNKWIKLIFSADTNSGKLKVTLINFGQV